MAPVISIPLFFNLEKDFSLYFSVTLFKNINVIASNSGSHL
jgi:hypothetical protein